MHQVKLAFGFLILVLSFSLPVFSQTEDQELDTIEAEIKKTETKKSEEQKEKERAADLKVDNLADLSKLSAFSDIAVMQRRYMPKTGRFQMNAGLSTMVNDPWNTSLGVNVRGSYNFTEMWGIEGQGFFMSTSQSVAAQDLFSQHNVNAKTSFGALSSYYGAHILWTPFYGKISLFNLRIIPFDMYFTAGGGTTNLDGGPVSTAPTFSVGTGQIFALSRSAAFRWDLTWNMYSIPSGSINNILLSFGASLYIPEATYR